MYLQRKLGHDGSLLKTILRYAKNPEVVCSIVGSLFPDSQTIPAHTPPQPAGGGVPSEIVCFEVTIGAKQSGGGGHRRDTIVTIDSKFRAYLSRSFS